MEKKMKKTPALTWIAAGALAATTLAQQETPTVQLKYATVDGLRIAYREAGPKSAKTIVLLHGFPSSSHMFRELIPRLATRYHVVAPDFVGFGYSDTPDPAKWPYTFDHLAAITEDFLGQVTTSKYSLYLQDYGGPVGFRLASKHPERIEGLIIQNANAYVEGLSELAMNALGKYGNDRSEANEKPLRWLMTAEGIQYQYLHGSPNPTSVNPDSYTLDSALFASRKDNTAIQLDLFADYKNNLALYNEWHAYFQKYQPKALIVWGKGDPFFTETGARAYTKDLKHVELNILDAGHFALEEKGPEIASKIIRFMGAK